MSSETLSSSLSVLSVSGKTSDQSAVRNFTSQVSFRELSTLLRSLVSIISVLAARRIKVLRSVKCSLGSRRNPHPFGCGLLHRAELNADDSYVNFVLQANEALDRIRRAMGFSTPVDATISEFVRRCGGTVDPPKSVSKPDIHYTGFHPDGSVCPNTFFTARLAGVTGEIPCGYDTVRLSGEWEDQYYCMGNSLSAHGDHARGYEAWANFFEAVSTKLGDVQFPEKVISKVCTYRDLPDCERTVNWLTQSGSWGSLPPATLDVKYAQVDQMWLCQTTLYTPLKREGEQVHYHSQGRAKQKAASKRCALLELMFRLSYDVEVPNLFEDTNESQNAELEQLYNAPVSETVINAVVEEEKAINPDGVDQVDADSVNA